MPFSHQPSAPPGRPRRPKDRDGHREARNTTSSSSNGKRTKESTSRNRTPPRALRPAQPSLYTQPNLTLDQLPALPASESGSPPACSPTLRVNLPPPNHNISTSSTVAIPAPPAAQFHTPAALQPYLDPEDDDEPSLDTASEPEASPNCHEPPALGRDSPKLVRESSALSHDPPKLVRESSALSHDPPKLVRESSTLSQDPPKPVLNETLQSLISIPQRTLSPKSAETAFFRSSSPPPSAPSPFWNQPHPVPGAFDSTQPFPPNISFVGRPPPFALAAPVLTGTRDQYYAAPPYGGSHYMTVGPSAGNIPNFQPAPHSIPYYPSYGPPQQTQPPFPTMYNPSTRGRSSRRSFSGEPCSKDPKSLYRPSDQLAQPGSSGTSNQTSEDDAVDLLQRIQSAIPDIHLLLDRYRETSGQLGARETLIRETEAQKTAALKKKEAHIEKLMLESEALSSKHSAESSKLRLEIGNMEEKHKELQDHLLSVKKSKDELKAKNKALQEEQQEAERALKELKATMDRESAVWKDVSRGYANHQKSLEADLQRVKQERDARFQAQETKMREDWAQERSGLHAEWARQKRNLEDGHARLRREWEMALESRQKALEESHRKHLQDKTTWDKEREASVHDWEQERSLLGKGSEEQRKILGGIFQKEKEEMQRKWQSSQARAHKQAEEAQAKLQREIERLKAGWDADKSKFAQATAELRNAVVKLNEDNVKLQKLAEAFGEVTDLKSREDPFYHEAFHHLQQQIMDLSVEQFQDAIDTIPRDVATRIPEPVLSFLSKPDSSVRLRAAFIEHTISSVITRRIFKPFLFTLNLRQQSADQLFQSWSDHMRSKSTRKEALWRQRTLHAAYTVSSAKQSINKVAGAIVDEIVDAIRSFAHPGRLEQVTLAVRKIVKTAAETWRYARLEIPMITASMLPENRPSFMNTRTVHDGAHAGFSAPDRAGQVLLPLFPIIEREAIHEDMREDGKMNDQGYTYFPGRMLYIDDPDVINHPDANECSNSSVVRPDSADAQLDMKNELSDLSEDDQSTLPEESAVSPSIRQVRKWQITPPPSASRGRPSDIGDLVHAQLQASSVNIGTYNPSQHASGRSESLTPTLSQSSVTNGSSTGTSTSTTRAKDLPDWGGKGAGIFGW